MKSVIKYLFLIFFILLPDLNLFAQKKYELSLDSLSYYFRHVKVIDPFHEDKKQLEDTVIFILTKCKNYGKNSSIKNIKGKSIIYINYSEHVCILDLNAYDTNSVLKTGEFVSLIDPSKHIYFNLRRRIGVRGFNKLSDLEFIADNEYNKEKFVHYFKQAIYNCNGEQFRRKKKYFIEEWDFDRINK